MMRDSIQSYMKSEVNDDIGGRAEKATWRIASAWLAAFSHLKMPGIVLNTEKKLFSFSFRKRQQKCQKVKPRSLQIELIPRMRSVVCCARAGAVMFLSSSQHPTEFLLQCLKFFCFFRRHHHQAWRATQRSPSCLRDDFIFEQ